MTRRGHLPGPATLRAQRNAYPARTSWGCDSHWGDLNAERIAARLESELGAVSLLPQARLSVVVLLEQMRTASDRAKWASKVITVWKEVMGRWLVWASEGRWGGRVDLT